MSSSVRRADDTTFAVRSSTAQHLVELLKISSMDQFQIVIVCSIIVFQFICTTNSEDTVKWIPLSEFLFGANPEPHGYSVPFKTNLYIGRTPKGQGYQVGYFLNTEDSLFVVNSGAVKSSDIEEEETQKVDKSSGIEMMVALPRTTSWRIIDSKKPDIMEKIRPNLVPGGKDPTGAEEVYICRVISRGVNGETNGHLNVGQYVYSMPLTCRAVRDSDLQLVQSDKFEVLTYSSLNEV